MSLMHAANRFDQPDVGHSFKDISQSARRQRPSDIFVALVSGEHYDRSVLVLLPDNPPARHSGFIFKLRLLHGPLRVHLTNATSPN